MMQSVFIIQRVIKNKFFWGIAIVLVLSFWGMRAFFAEEKNVPQEFTEARERSIELTASIIGLVDGSSKQLEAIAKEDEGRNFEQAINLVSKSLDINRDARDKATALAQDLEIMAKNLVTISPIAIQRVATHAIGAQVLLISHLITYNDLYSQLLEVLRSKFLGAQVDLRIKDLVLKITGEIEIINKLNSQLIVSLSQFDGYLK